MNDAPSAGPRFAGRVDDVARGADGRLFLARGDGFDAAEMFAEPFDDLPRLERLWRIGLERRLRLCREAGAALVVLVAPEAHGVHADALPAPLAYARPSVADRFAALARSLGVTAVFARDALAAARGPVEVFRRDDSHWTAWGALLAYQAVMDALPGKLARGRLATRSVRFAWCEAMGDLAGSEGVRGLRFEPVFEAPRSHIVLQRSNERRHALKITEIDDASLPTAVVFRDSFGSELAPFLAESFRRMVLLGCEERAYLEIVAEERPDVVILERSERALLNGVIDWGPETWREAFPDPGSDAAAHAAELAARAHLASGEANLAAEEAQQAIGADPTVERTILAGRIALTSGHAQAATAMLETAVGRAPDRWTALIHLGVARMACGHAEAARDFFARACATAPWNPGGFEHFGFAALHCGDAAGAVSALHTAVRLGPEVPGAQLWLIEALHRLDRPAEAAAALLDALRLCPQDPLLQARARTPLPPAGEGGARREAVGG